jgi:formamidopyrimidine-DNA glycosylase
MPELPDVELFKRHFDETSRDRTVARVEVLEARVLEGLAPAAFAARLQGRRLGAGRRHGKHLLIALDDGTWLALHFGMTGRLQYFAEPQDDPPYDRVRFDFADGGHLAYVNVRLLGRVRLVADAEAFLAGIPVGPDALDPGFDLAAFEAMLAGRRGGLKAVLMDQSLVAGIGNIYADEILFDARLHPGLKPAALDAAARRRLFHSMKQVLETTIACGAGSESLFERLPAGYLLPHRRLDGACPRCGGGLDRIAIGGRRGYFCPRCQPAPP